MVVLFLDLLRNGLESSPLGLPTPWLEDSAHVSPSQDPSAEWPETPRAAEVPFPPLLGGPGFAAEWTGPKLDAAWGSFQELVSDHPYQHRPELRALLRDSPLGREHGTARPLLLDSPEIRPGRSRALLLDPPEEPAPGDPHGPEQDEAEQPQQSHGTSSRMASTGGKRDDGGGGSYLKLHSSFPPAFFAKPGESWKDYWRSVEFWLASEGAHLPSNVRAGRLMQQLKERTGKIVNHLTIEDISGDGGVMKIKEEMEKSPIIRLLEHKEVDRKRQKFMRLAW